MSEAAAEVQCELPAPMHITVQPGWSNWRTADQKSTSDGEGAVKSFKLPCFVSEEKSTSYTKGGADSSVAGSSQQTPPGKVTSPRTPKKLTPLLPEWLLATRQSEGSQLGQEKESHGTQSATLGEAFSPTTNSPGRTPTRSPVRSRTVGASYPASPRSTSLTPTTLQAPALFHGHGHTGEQRGSSRRISRLSRRGSGSSTASIMGTVMERMRVYHQNVEVPARVTPLPSPQVSQNAAPMSSKLTGRLSGALSSADLEEMPTYAAKARCGLAFTINGLIIFAVVANVVVTCICMMIILDSLSEDAEAIYAEAVDMCNKGKLPPPVKMHDRAWRARVGAIIVCTVTILLSLLTGCLLGGTVSNPVRSVTALMESFAELDSVGSTMMSKICMKAGSRLVDIRKLQAAFCKLSRGMDMFKRYVPDTVVRDIIRGEDRVLRLHVSQRYVTIMFTDIVNFTGIAEGLKQVDLLFMLTRYFSIMTRIVEMYQGMVAEILGDGLVVFWNTPDDVVDHAAKACAAALAQQQVLEALNQELAIFHLPKLSIRIGLHTGCVLSGNIGSETKMKFGCVGDPINLASRMEGLCKHYGVSIICSGSTFDNAYLHSFIFRQLDIVQVKGKSQSTRVYQLFGISEESADEEFADTQMAAGFAMQASTNALMSADALDWNPLRRRRRRTPSKETSGAAAAGEEGLASIASGASGLQRSQSMRQLTFPESPFIEKKLSSECLLSVSEETRAMGKAYERALQAFQQGRLLEAKVLLERLLESWPEDSPSKLLLERTKRHVGPDDKVVGLSTEELAVWNGVEILQNK